MRAVTQDELGGAEVLRLRDLPRPRPGPTEVLVRMRAAGVNPVDWKTRQSGGFLGPPPFVLGWDVCGEVVELGPGTTGLAIGDEVLGLVRFPREAGAYAEYVVAPSRQLVRRPKYLGVLEGAGLPLAGLTAWQALVDVADVRPGQRVLIQAAAGGVGHLAAQVAAARGAVVLGTARPEKHDFLRSLGVQEPIDYTVPGWDAGVGDLDLVLDPFGGDAASWARTFIRPGGLMVTLRSTPARVLATAAGDRGARVVPLIVEPDPVGLHGLIDLIQRGCLRVHVDRSYPLEHVADAHRKGETGGTTGKIVLDIG